ncbi:MAG: hypothetical protein NPIRA02_19700 [Nitrospirales bacterium]|nr:MAG: hypothetical protein NPIRA02_19700 [Nitrospirales bacterium]
MTWEAIKQWSSTQGTLWIHLDRTEAESRRWLQEESGVNPIIEDALLEAETRPRSVVINE